MNEAAETGPAKVFDLTTGVEVTTPTVLTAEASPSTEPAKASKKKKKADEDEKTPRKPIAAYVGPDGSLAELVKHPTKGMLLAYYSARRKQITYKQSLGVKCNGEDEILYAYPDKKNLIGSGVVTLPTVAASYKSTADILDKMVGIFREYAFGPDRWPYILSAYCLSTWIYDAYDAVAYVKFMGEGGSGKGRFQEIARGISYRGTLVNGASTAAVIFRIIDLFRGTMICDESDFDRSDAAAMMAKIINIGNQRSGVVLRCDNEDKFAVEPFSAYCPKIFGGKSLWADDSLETRCLRFNTEDLEMPATMPRGLHQGLDIWPRMEEIRNMALRWRFDHFGKVRADETPLLNFDNRTVQVCAPIYAILPDKNWQTMFLDFLADKQGHDDDNAPKARMARLLLDPAMRPLSDKRVADIQEAWNAPFVTDSYVDKEQMLSDKAASKLIRHLGFELKHKNDGNHILPTQKSQDAYAKIQRKYGGGKTKI
jgi:hypothetical protein